MIAGLAAVFLFVWLLPTPPALHGIANYLPMHMAMESFAIVVAMLVFGITWNAYSSARAGNVIMLACAMLAVGLLDFAHMLSFKGMPDFVTPSGTEKTISFWLAARFIAALALLVAAVRPWTPLPSPRRKHALLLGALAVTALVFWVVLRHQAALPRTFVEGTGLTPFKVGMEYLIVGLLVVPAIIFYRQSRRGVPHDAAGLFAAAAISILSELSFTLYKDVTDIFNLLGHTYKVVAYLFIYRAMFVTNVREPFQRLAAAEARYRAIFAGARDGIVMMDAETGLIADCNPEFERQCGRPLAELRTLHIWELRPAEQRAAARRKFEEIRDAGEGGGSGLDFERPDGSRLPIEFVSRSIRIGGCDYLQSISRDISEHRELQSSLERQLDELRRFQDVAVGRELRMKALVEENARLGAPGGTRPTSRRRPSGWPSWTMTRNPAETSSRLRGCAPRSSASRTSTAPATSRSKPRCAPRRARAKRCCSCWRISRRSAA